MSRQFGLSSRPALGANTQGGPLSRGGGPREPVLESSSTAERGVLSAMVAGSNPASPAKFQLAGKTSRPANSRGESPESFIREGAAAFFVAAFASFPVVTVWFLCAVIDWEGVWETIVRMFDLG